MVNLSACSERNDDQSGVGGGGDPGGVRNAGGGRQLRKMNGDANDGVYVVSDVPHHSHCMWTESVNGAAVQIDGETRCGLPLA